MKWLMRMCTAFCGVMFLCGRRLKAWLGSLEMGQPVSDGLVEVMATLQDVDVYTVRPVQATDGSEAYLLGKWMEARRLFHSFCFRASAVQHREMQCQCVMALTQRRAGAP